MSAGAASLLRAAADWLEEDPKRWGREYYLDEATGCRCAMGAISLVADPTHQDYVLGDPWFTSDVAVDAVHMLAEYVLSLNPPPDDYGDSQLQVVSIIGEWNDRPGRTAAEVIAALRAAADGAA